MVKNVKKCQNHCTLMYMAVCNLHITVHVEELSSGEGSKGVESIVSNEPYCSDVAVITIIFTI
jgi:hypothetical protein